MPDCKPPDARHAPDAPMMLLEHESGRVGGRAHAVIRRLVALISRRSPQLLQLADGIRVVRVKR